MIRALLECQQHGQHLVTVDDVTDDGLVSIRMANGQYRNCWRTELVDAWIEEDQPKPAPVLAQVQA